jgi:hypothetical protein
MKRETLRRCHWRNERMSPKAEVVKQISATGFREAIELMVCLAVLREGSLLKCRVLLRRQMPLSQQPLCETRFCSKC